MPIVGKPTTTSVGIALSILRQNWNSIPKNVSACGGKFKKVCEWEYVCKECGCIQYVERLRGEPIKRPLYQKIQKETKKGMVAMRKYRMLCTCKADDWYGIGTCRKPREVIWCSHYIGWHFTTTSVSIAPSILLQHRNGSIPYLKM